MAETRPPSNPPPIWLASTSRYRRELLGRLGLPFDCEAPGVEETRLPGESPQALAQRLALGKARAVAERHPGALVIGSDQVCALGERVFGKPGDAAGARAQLADLSGHTAQFFTAVAIVGVHAGIWKQHLDETRCVFRSLGPDEIAAYVEAERPFDCAGSFKVEGLGITLFERIESQDPTALIGLPLIWTSSAMAAARGGASSAAPSAYR